MARIDDMTDVTPSPAAEGPFTLAIEHTLADGTSTETRNHTFTPADRRLLQLSHEGKTLTEIGEILYNEELAAHTTGSTPNV
jgi:hypothetical protein